MFRKFAAALLILLALAIGWWFVGEKPMALTLNIGGGNVTAVQTPAVNTGQSTTVTATLPLPSTAGTCLVAIIGLVYLGSSITAAPPGWVFVILNDQGGATPMGHIEAWIYPNNPGGLSTFNFTQAFVTGSHDYVLSISEWKGVSTVGAVEASGSSNSAAGTTLAPTTTGNVLTAGDLAISAWVQVRAASAACTFTTPGGFTRLIDDGALAVQVHLDAEYQSNPATGAPLGPTLTSTATTTSAAGLIIVLKGPNPAVDQTAFIKYGSLAVKQNTLDVALIDPATVPSLGDPVALTNPTWNGRVVSVTKADIVDVASGHKLVTITATNQTTAPVTQPPGNLTDTLAPLAGGHFLLNDGVSALLLNSGDYLLLGSTLFSYSGLSVKTTQNIDGTTSTYGMVTVYEAGYAAGQTITITSGNLGLSAVSYLITNVTQTYRGAASTSGAYLIEFGDPYLSLQLAGAGVLTKQGSVASIQPGVYMSAGVLGYAQVTANQTSITTAVDLTGLTVTVTIVSGRRIRITGSAEFLSTVAEDRGNLYIKEGATFLGSFAKVLQGGAAEVTIAEVILTPTAGVHTYKLSADRSGTGTLTMFADNGTSFAPAFLLVEDIGT